MNEIPIEDIMSAVITEFDLDPDEELDLLYRLHPNEEENMYSDKENESELPDFFFSKGKTSHNHQ